MTSPDEIETMPTMPMSNRTEEPVADWLHARRTAISWCLVVFAIGLLLVAGYCGYRGFRVAPAQTESGEPPIGQTTLAAEFDPTPFKVVTIAAFLAAVTVGGIAGYLIGVLPSADETERRRRDRTLILAGGGVLGVITLLCGATLFALWFNKLGDWINGVPGAQKTAWMPVVAILLFLIGAGIAFLAAIPARGEERNNSLLRRLVYSSNLGLSVLLGLVGLVVLNVLISIKLPTKLDTTESGFYSLTEQTRNYIAGLKQDVKVYVLPAEAEGRADRVQTDAMRLLSACAEINPQRFQVKTLSPVLDRNEIETLAVRYPDANLRAFGVLITTGENFDRRGFIEFSKMVGRGQMGRMTFKGEAELIRELMFRTERESVVYFTQSSREPLIEQPNDPNAPSVRTALRLKDDLARSQCVVKPLTLEAPGAVPKVPDDAELVIVVDPMSALPETTVTAIQNYLTGASAGKKKGRLLVFAGARSNIASKEVMKTGLEPLLESNGIQLADRVIYSEPTGRLPVQSVFVLPEESLQAKRNPVALLLSSGIVRSNARPVRSLYGKSTTLISTLGGRSWVESKLYEPPSKAWQELVEAAQRGDVPYQQERQVTTRPVPLAAFSADQDGSPRIAVFGFSDGFDDTAPVAEDGRSDMSKVLTTAVDWLRERPPAPDIAPKSYGEYQPPKNVSTTHLLHLPVLSTLIGIIVLGLGVWVYRRK